MRRTPPVENEPEGSQAVGLGLRIPTSAIHPRPDLGVKSWEGGRLRHDFGWGEGMLRDLLPLSIIISP